MKKTIVIPAKKSSFRKIIAIPQKIIVIPAKAGIQ
jgi:hypothetical protein